MKRRPTIFAVLVASLLAVAPAAADDSGMGDGSWFLIGPQYGTRQVFGVPGPGEDNTSDGVSRSGETHTITQNHFALNGRAMLWSDLNKTAQGHRGGMNLDFLIGWNMSDDYFDETGATGIGCCTPEDERAAFDNGGGGIIFGFKGHFPWTLIDSGWLRIGPGAGFGLIWDMGRTYQIEPEWPGFDLDAALGVTADIELGWLFVNGTYEYAPFSLVYENEHRFRGTVALGSLGVGVDIKLSELAFKNGEDETTAQSLHVGLTVGYMADWFTN